MEQSRDDELARQQQMDAQEQSDLAAALFASAASPQLQQQQQQHTLYHARSQTLPSFSASDFAASSYLPEKQRAFPQGRPALPPGAGSAWDDEQREMELLAEAIRISKEEEDERLRLETAEVEEALRRSELAATTSGAESSEAGMVESADEASSSEVQPSASTSPRSPRGRRHSWLRPPLTSKLAGSPPSSPPLANAPLPPPRPLPTNRQDSVQTVDTFRTAPEALPFSNLDVVSESPAPPPRPARPPPPPPPSSAPAPSARPPTRPPVSPPKTPLVGSDAGAAAAAAAPASVPYPSPQNLAIPESYRDDNNGSPYELPFLTPSSSLRSNGQTQQHLRPGLGSQWDSRSGGSSYDPLSTSSHSGEHSRRLSSSTVHAGSSGGRADGDSHSASSAQSDASGGPPMSPLSVRNPDDGTPSDSSRASTLSSVSSASTATSGDDGERVESLWIEDLPMFPAGLTGVSAYAGRSMSAIDETTEPASSVYATEQGGADEVLVDEAGQARDRRFPEEVSIASSGASAGRLPDEPALRTPLDERTWLAGGASEGAPTSRPPMPQGLSSSRAPALPPGAGPTAYGAPARPQPDAPTELSTLDAAAAVAQDMQEDGLRFGHPAQCSRELAHACPADGLCASEDVPARIELSCAAGEGDDEEGGAPRAEWAIEAYSWVALVRALMWHGDATIFAARDDLAQSRSQRCAATARLEFRPDDEGLPVLRLVVGLVPPREASTHLAEHRELSVTRPPCARPAPHEGKGKARASDAQPQRATPTGPLATFALPDLLHLPTRLSSLAIQLYTLRHLAGIARATQPATPSADTAHDAAGYTAMRELADAISALARAAQDRDRQHEPDEPVAPPSTGVSAPSAPAPASGTNAASTSNAATPLAVPPRPRSRPQAPEEQNARLVTRLRDRLRRLKRRGPAPSSAAGVASSGSSAASADGPERAPARDGPPQANKLVKPMPPARATAVRRSERVLAAEEVADGAAGGRGAQRPAQPQPGRRKSGMTPADEQRELRYLPTL